MEQSLLKQEIEFLQFQLEDFKTREIQQKTMYEAMIKSLQTPTSDELEKYKTMLTELQEKQEESVNTENLLKSQLEYLQESTKLTISDLKTQIFQINSEKQSLESELDQLKQNSQDFNSLKTSFSELLQVKEQLEIDLDKQKFDSIKRQERIIEDLEYLHQSKLSNLNTLIENLYSRIAENSQGNVTKEIRSLISHSQLSKTAEIIRSVDRLKNVIESVQSSEIQSALFSMLSLYEDLNPEAKSQISKHGRSYTFAPSENSPIGHSKENDPEQHQKKLETIFTFSTSFQCEFCKILISKNKIYDHLADCMNEKQAKVHEKQAKNNEKTEPLYDIAGIGKMEEQISNLKLTLGKLKNQRDKAKIVADQLLGSLKQAKLELAMAEEEGEQKAMELKFEVKNLVNFLMVVRNHSSFPSGFLYEMDKIVERASKIFGGRCCVRSSS